MFLEFAMVEVDGELFFVFNRLVSPEASTEVKHVARPGHGREDVGKISGAGMLMKLCKYIIERFQCHVKFLTFAELLRELMSSK